MSEPRNLGLRRGQSPSDGSERAILGPYSLWGGDGPPQTINIGTLYIFCPNLRSPGLDLAPLAIPSSGFWLTSCCKVWLHSYTGCQSMSATGFVTSLQTAPSAQGALSPPYISSVGTAIYLSPSLPQPEESLHWRGKCDMGNVLPTSWCGEEKEEWKGNKKH